MMESDARSASSVLRNAKSRRHATLLSLVVVTAFATGGCSLLDTGVPLQQTQANALPSATDGTAAGEESNRGPMNDSPGGGVDDLRTPPPASAADVMFQSTDSPLLPHTSNVNVFGEVDGIPNSPFASSSANGLQQHTYVDEGYDADPTISPDGKWILFSSTRNSEHADIYIQRVDGLAVTQLTADDADDAYPRFSRDGKEIVFASNRTGNWDLYLMDADGKRVRSLTRSPAQEIHPSFSPDGTRIVYSALGSRSGQWELWTLDIQTGERKMIGYGLFPDWSPRRDHDVIAFQRARQRGTRWFSAWTLDLVDGEAKNVTEVAYSGTNAIIAPTWNVDGTRLAYCTISDPDSGIAPKDIKRPKPPRQDVWTINADGSDRIRITDGRGMNAMPTWAGDGRLFFVSDRNGPEAIFSMNTPMASAFEPARASAKSDPIEPVAVKPEPHEATAAREPMTAADAPEQPEPQAKAETPAEPETHAQADAPKEPEKEAEPHGGTLGPAATPSNGHASAGE